NKKAKLVLRLYFNPLEIGRAGDGRDELQEYPRASERGDASSQWKLGLLHYGGISMPQNKALASSWFAKAAAQNDPAGMYWFANSKIYEKGASIAQKKEGFALLMRAAEAGDANAEQLLGSYYTGTDKELAPKDVAK